MAGVDAQSARRRDVLGQPAAGVGGPDGGGSGSVHLTASWRPVGWLLVTIACLLWLPYALAASSPGTVLAVAAFAAVSLGNYRRAHRRPIWPRRQRTAKKSFVE
jgi:hypothetical protein